MILLFFDMTERGLLSGLSLKKQTGRTTRIVDRCIQELFTNGVCYIYDGRGTDTEKSDTQKAIEVFTSRMYHEHGHIHFSTEFGEFDHIKCYKIVLS